MTYDDDDDDIFSVMVDKLRGKLQKSVGVNEKNFNAATKSVLNFTDPNNPEKGWRNQILFELAGERLSVTALMLDYYDLARQDVRLKRWFAASLGLIVGGLGYLAASPFLR